MYLQTSFGTLTSAYSYSIQSSFQDSIQGNRATLVLWLIIGILLIRYFYLKGLVSKHFTPISNISFQLAAFLYIDDSDLNILNLNRKSNLEVIKEAQALLNI